jgi:hypothetical protein
VIFDKGGKNIWWRKDRLQQIFSGKLDICMQKTETRFMSVTLCKYQLTVN